MLHVPYKGIAPAMTAILAGDIQISYATPLSALQYLKSGRLVALAVAAPERFPTLPDVPTAAEAGLPGYDVDFWYGLLGPAGMSAALVDRIQKDVAAVFTSPEAREGLLAQGCVAVASQPQALNELIARDYEKWAKVVKAGGVKVE
jgi:tripartite-type tricarboxylate transporter receptor subunit TctC